MIARRRLPASFIRWNRYWHAPSGRPLPFSRTLGLRKHTLRNNRLAVRYRGPFALQPNNSTRAFEYPWAFERIAAHGSCLDVVEVGGGLSGMQFVLAREGHSVTNVDPGLAAPTLGWALEPSSHELLCEAFSAHVKLIPTTLDDAALADCSADIVLCVSVIEHLSPDEQRSLATSIRRILRPNGAVVMTADLFLDVVPFSRVQSNRYGTNVDLRMFCADAGLVIREGNTRELYGFPDFDPSTILENLSQFLVGRYPCLTQCIVAVPA